MSLNFLMLNLLNKDLLSLGSPAGSVGKESACNAGDLGSIPGLGRSLEEGMATHFSILAWRISLDRGAWWATVHGVERVGHNLATKLPPQVIIERSGGQVYTARKKP